MSTMSLVIVVFLTCTTLISRYRSHKPDLLQASIHPLGISLFLGTEVLIVDYHCFLAVAVIVVDDLMLLLVVLLLVVRVADLGVIASRCTCGQRTNNSMWFAEKTCSCWPQMAAITVAREFEFKATRMGGGFIRVIMCDYPLKKKKGIH